MPSLTWIGKDAVLQLHRQIPYRLLRCDDALSMAVAMGSRLAHVHLADGSGSNRDEHLVPGRGAQPCSVLLERLAGQSFDGAVVLEVNTRKAANRAEREADLAEALAFTRLNLVAAEQLSP